MRHRSERSREQGVFARMMAGLASEHGEKMIATIDAPTSRPRKGVEKGAQAPDRPE